MENKSMNIVHYLIPLIAFLQYSRTIKVLKETENKQHQFFLQNSPEISW